MYLRPIKLKGFKKKLRHFQRQGVYFIFIKKGRAIVGDEMGLGKTIQALAYIHLMKKKRPVVIVVPGNLKPNWEREINLCMPGTKVQVIYGRKNTQKLWGDVIIINYDILPNKYRYKKNPMFPSKKIATELPRTGWVDFIKDIKPQIIIFDECHYLINTKAQRTKASAWLAKGVPSVIGLSGTPSKNRAREIDTIVRIIRPSLLPSFWKTAHRYYGAKLTRFGWNFDGATHTKEFHKLLKNVMIRRKKKDVLKELPPKIRSIVPIELDNKREYKEAEVEFLKWLLKRKGLKAAEKAKRAQHLVKIETLKQLAVEGKIRSAIEWIRNFLTTEDKLFVLATHTKTIDRIMEAFGKDAVRYDGTISAKKRDANLQRFQTDKKVKLLVGMFDKSGNPAGIGITATAAAALCFIELQWSPGVHDQAEDRVHRMTQTRGVNIYYLVGLDTIEIKIVEILDKKRKVLARILDGERIKSKSTLTMLLNQTLKELQNAKKAA